MTTRRTLLLALGAALLDRPRAAAAQRPAKTWRVGYLAAGARPADDLPPAALRRALLELGYVPGRNVEFVTRFAQGRSERLPDLARELVASKADVLVTLGWKGAHALLDATATIPVVFVGAGDPVAAGLVATLARPGRNATGISDQSTELSAKRMELLLQLVPNARRIAVLWNADDLAMTLRYREIERAARTLTVSVQALGVHEPEDFDQAFASMVKDRPDALMLVTDALTILNRRRVLEFTTQRSIPAMFEFGSLVREGGLVSYGPDFDDMFARAGVYIDRILHGTPAGELPVEQPTRYYLLINVATARALGLSVPASLMLRADEIVK
ncbi:MAG TPA: ABC transporter substrate-binding protein [Casimicrobiaceae bacterium]|nr:ABC transporter substrate-binding protein [Casimicrobiaceae bacterium]